MKKLLPVPNQKRHGGAILSESVSEHMKEDLVVKTIKKAIRRYAIPEGCIFHRDPALAQIKVVIIHIQNVAALTSFRDHTLIPRTNEIMKNM